VSRIFEGSAFSLNHVQPTEPPAWLEEWVNDQWTVTREGASWTVTVPVGNNTQVEGPGSDTDVPIVVRLVGNANNRKLVVRGSWPIGSGFTNTDNHLEITVADGATLLRPKFMGRMVLKSQIPLSEPEFEPADEEVPRIDVVGRGQVLDATGSAHVQFAQGGLISGLTLAPFAALSVGGQAKATEASEMDWVDLFSCSWASLPVLVSLNRLNPAFPRRRATRFINRTQSLKRARQMQMGTTQEAISKRRLAAFWERLARALRTQGVGGSGEVVTRYLAYEFRRRAAPKSSAEYWLLGFSRIFGYGTRIALPLAWWLIGALIAAWAFIDFGPWVEVWSRNLCGTGLRFMGSAHDLHTWFRQRRTRRIMGLRPWT
jgi:hypothetical protein